MENQLLKIGARATIGVALAAIATGSMPSRKRTQRAAASEVSKAADTPMTKPPRASERVLNPAPHTTSHVSTKLEMISLGLGSTNVSIPKRRVRPSQRRITTRKENSAGRYLPPNSLIAAGVRPPTGTSPSKVLRTSVSWLSRMMSSRSVMTLRYAAPRGPR